MELILQPWQFYFLILAGCVNRQQQQVIEYLRTENQVLREIYGSKWMLLHDDQLRPLNLLDQKVPFAHSGISQAWFTPPFVQFRTSSHCPTRVRIE